MNKINTIFIGSGEFSIDLINTLLNLDFISVKAVITQPDKPTGRKQLLTPTPLKSFLLSKQINLPIIEPEKISDEYEEIINTYRPELIIVASYGQIIPKLMITAPKYGTLNLHGSLLPLLRGATPVPMAILKGLSETGVTLQKMVFEMDKGPIIATRKIQLDNSINTEDLMLKLSKLGSEILNTDLKKWINNEIKGVLQDESQATYCYKEEISKDKAEIIYATDIELADRMIRGFYPWPIAWVRLDNKILKLYKTGHLIHEEDDSNINLARLIKKDKKIYLKLKNGLIELLEIQLEGKKRDIASNYNYLVNS